MLDDPGLISKYLLTSHDVIYSVDAKATYYKRFIRVFIPNIPYSKMKLNVERFSQKNYKYESPDLGTRHKSKLPLGITDDQAQKYLSNTNAVTHVEDRHDIVIHRSAVATNARRLQSLPPNETDIDRSIRRTRKAIKDYVFSNDFDMFATFTFKQDRQDVALCKKRMATWFKNERTRKGKISYLIVPEFHKDGKSIHFHALMAAYKGALIRSVNSKTNKLVFQKGRQVYSIPSFTHGFTNVKLIDDKQYSQTKVGFYLQKYVTKDMPMFFGKNRYWASRSLSRPITEDNPDEWYKHAIPDRTYSNENGLLIEFDVGKQPLIDMVHRNHKHEA